MTAFAKAIDEEVHLRKAVKQNVKSRTFTNNNRKKVTKDGNVNVLILKSMLTINYFPIQGNT